MSFSNYNHIIFDFDGVIADTNELKKNAIATAAKNHMPNKEANDFVEYFIKYNGIPREIKIKKFFSDEKYPIVLQEYGMNIKKEIQNIDLTKGAKKFIEELAEVTPNLHILSGGNKEEILDILERHGLKDCFQTLSCGPEIKEDHLDKLQFTGKVLYFGDSQKDFEIAENYGFDFIFVYGYTQLTDWQGLVDKHQPIMIIEDFSGIKRENSN